jgi:hypothetical protein
VPVPVPVPRHCRSSWGTGPWNQYFECGLTDIHCQD